MKLMKTIAIASALLFSVSVVSLNADDCTKKCSGMKGKAKTECTTKAKAECDSKKESKAEVKKEEKTEKSESKVTKNETK